MQVHAGAPGGGKSAVLAHIVMTADSGRAAEQCPVTLQAAIPASPMLPRTCIFPGIRPYKIPGAIQYTVARWARGCLHAAAGDHAAAVTDLLAAGELVTRWGAQNPAMIPWRSAAALSLAALGDRREASRLCAQEIGIARQWGACRGVGIALRAAGLAEGGDRGIELLAEAVSVLRRSAARLELARALLDLGAAHRRAGTPTRARECLRESLDLGPRPGRPGPGRPGPAGTRRSRRPAPPRRHLRTRRADAQRTARRAAGRRRADQPAERPGPVRHPANRGKPPDQHLRQTRHQLPARAAGRAGQHPPAVPPLAASRPSGQPPHRPGGRPRTAHDPTPSRRIQSLRAARRSAECSHL